MEELVKYSGLVSLFLVIIGWIVIYRNACKIATRSETKSLIDDVIGILGDIESLSVAFWLSGRQNRIGSDEFILLFNAKLLTLNSRLKILKNRKINVEAVDLSELSEKITYQCEDVDRIVPSKKRESVQAFLDVISIANEELYTEFQRYHKPTH